MITKILRDPLLHFLILGGLLFFVYQVRNGSDDDMTIRISNEQVELLKRQYQQTWMDEPSSEAADIMIESFVLDEIYAREAFKLSMHTDDPVVKKRMRMKMELLTDLLVAQPSDEEIKAFYEANIQRYSEGHRFSFKHVYFENKRTTTELASTLQRLRQGELVSSDVSMLRGGYDNASMRAIQREFGGDFVNWLSQLDINVWQGPFQSPLGWHFVCLEISEEAPATPLEKVYQLVVEDVKAQQRQVFKSKQQQELLQQYRIERD